MNIPIIAVTSNDTRMPVNFSANQHITLVNNSYLNIISDFGAIPLIVPNTIKECDARIIAEKCNGLLLIGGQDISPAGYNVDEVSDDAMYNKVFKPDSKRDMIEIQLYKEFYNMHKPILGICRGMQLINVAEGGTLYEDLPKDQVRHSIEEDGWINYHEIFINKNSKAFELLGKEKYVVSSVHHQGIKRLGNNLVISAIAEDNIAEIIESDDKERFVIGIQGHPENIRKNFNRYNNIFNELIRRARE